MYLIALSNLQGPWLIQQLVLYRTSHDWHILCTG